MTRRRKTAPGMTLFAFQDIIMSTSGIVIMMVLLLTLELVQRDGQAEQRAPIVDGAQLEREIQTAEREIAAFEQRLRESDALVQTMSTVSPAELKRQVQQLRDENTRLAQQVGTLRGRRNELRNGDDELAAERERIELLKKQLAERQQEQRRLQTALESAVSDDRPIFSFPRGSRQSGWLVVISDQEIKAAPLGRSAKPLAFRAGGGFLGMGSADGAFLKWADSLPTANSYFFLIVRPDGVDPFERITESFDQDGIPYGFDVTGQDQAILNPQRGAVQ